MGRIVGKRMARRRPEAKRRLPAEVEVPRGALPSDVAAQMSALQVNPQTAGHLSAKASIVRHDADVAAARGRIADAQASMAAAVAAAAAAEAAAEDEGAAEELTPHLTPDLAQQLVRAVCSAVGQFAQQANFRNIKIHGGTAHGGPGCLQGPRLDTFVNTSMEVASLTGPQAELREAVAEGVGDAFASWRDHVTVPALLWWPVFAGWPGKQAPPTPNVPWPLASCTSSTLSEIVSKDRLGAHIRGALPDAIDTGEVRGFCDALAMALCGGFAIWCAAARVSNVMGFGPCPTVNPPISPVGPVIDGTIIPAPGHLAGSPPMPPLPAPLH